MADVTYAATSRGCNDVEYATFERVAWFHQQRCAEPLGYLPPTTNGEQFDRAQATRPGTRALNGTILRATEDDLIAAT